jgi:hypothetical protein
MVWAPDQRLRVFISSTLVELAPERQAAKEAVSALELSPIMFEDGARPYPPREVYESSVKQSQIFIGLYWEQYGWVSPAMTISGLEDEFNLSRGMPRLLYVKQPALGRDPQLTALIRKIEADGGHSYGKFSTPDELRQFVRRDLARLLGERFGGPGLTSAEPSRPRVLAEASLSEAGVLKSAVWLDGALADRTENALPDQVNRIWSQYRQPPAVAVDRVAEAGRRSGQLLFGETGGLAIADALNALRPDEHAEVVLCADGPALELPFELVRMTATGDPLGLLPGVAVSRRITAVRADSQTGPPAPARQPVTLPGPLKILAAVAAPDESSTGSAPLDVEAEMQAVLDAVTEITGLPGAQVRFLEVASLDQIRDALARDAYHVLHLSAHGSPEAVELEDEDGQSHRVTATDLVAALRHAGKPVPLIVLSSCSGGAGSQAMAAALIGQGADRVIAMLAPVTDTYATTLARHLYAELARHPDRPVGLSLTWARRGAEDSRRRDRPGKLAMPEYGLVTLLTAGADAPLVDQSAPAQPLRSPAELPAGGTVRELPLGILIGRHPELRTALAILRKTRTAIDRHGYSSGVQLTGIGGIGKTALAGRIISRLRADGWLVAVHEGRWSPTALIAPVAESIPDGQAKQLLTDPASDDPPKLAAVAGLLARQKLLVVFDDFEQNLTAGGEDFLDLAFADQLTALAKAAGTGALLITSRYPVPGPDRYLTRIELPSLSAAELRRMFLRMPALRDLDPEGQHLITRSSAATPA